MPLPGVSAVPNIKPYALPAAFQWLTVDPNNADHMKGVQSFLDENTTEDDDMAFRLHYDQGALRRVLTSTLTDASIFLGVNALSAPGLLKLVGFICAVPITLRIFNKVETFYTVQLLCVHKKLRDKKLAKVLVRELVRRIQIEAPQVRCAMFGLGVQMPFNLISEAHIFHRSINALKLIETNYIDEKFGAVQLPVPRKEFSTGFRPMEQKDIESAWRLVSSFLSQFAVAPVYTLGEFEARYFEDSRVDHYAGLPDRKVQQVHSYVIEDPQTHEITDFVSYFHFLQRVIGNPKHEFIKSSFIEIVVPNPALNGPERSAELVDNLILASSNAGMDQVECVDLMNASSYLERCGFRKGTGKMLYYLHNWLTGSPIDSANWAILQL